MPRGLLQTRIVHGKQRMLGAFTHPFRSKHPRLLVGFPPDHHWLNQYDVQTRTRKLRLWGGGGGGDQPAFDHRAVTSFHLLVLCMLPPRFAFCELVASRNIKDVREPKPLRCEVFSVDVFLSAPLLSAVMPGRPHQIALFCQPPAVCGWKKIFSDDPGLIVERSVWEWN